MQQTTENKLPRKWYTIRELAEYLRISERTLKNWRSDHRIPFVKIKGRVLFNLESVEKALDTYEVSIANLPND